MKEINNKFIEFINKTPNAFCCVSNIKEILNKEGFKELYETEVWDNLDINGKYYVSRNDSSIIAFKMADVLDKAGFNIVAAHTDSPSFAIKPNPEMKENGYIKLNVDGYGGMINYTWLDRPLSVAGRVITKSGETYKKQIVNIDKDLLIIPSQAIHINREVNEKCGLNPQIDMLPIMSLDENVSMDKVITQYLKSNNESSQEICDYDLYLYNRDKAKYVGNDNDFILSPRLDDLGSLFPALCAFVESDNKSRFNIFCAFNNEEIGSLTAQGADSTFLMDILTKICQSKNIDSLKTIANSFIVSADNAHAIHPNAGGKSDPTNKVYLNKGVVIKHHINYTTDSLTSSLFKGVCARENVPVQDFACRSDMRCGATLGGISQSHVSIDSVDIGLPQLAMHSANELIGSKDLDYMYKALNSFYQTNFIKEKDTVKIEK